MSQVQEGVVMSTLVAVCEAQVRFLIPMQLSWIKMQKLLLMQPEEVMAAMLFCGQIIIRMCLAISAHAVAV